MRECKVIHYANDRSQCQRDVGLFHCWAQEFEELEAGPGNMTIALVELSDGRIVTVQPTDVQFVVTPEEFEIRELRREFLLKLQRMEEKNKRDQLKKES